MSFRNDFSGAHTALTGLRLLVLSRGISNAKFRLISMMSKLPFGIRDLDIDVDVCGSLLGFGDHC